MTAPEKRNRIDEWFVRWKSPLRKFLANKRKIPMADREDVAQEVFVRVLRYARVESVEHPQAYLYRMAANVAAEWVVRARLMHPHDPEWLAELSVDDQPDETIARREAEQKVRSTVKNLPLRQRQILKLRFTDGLEQRDIAARLGISERIVKRDLAKSYASLRIELDPELLSQLINGRE